ncbi:MAG: nucleotidyltransferase domain-containing protein [Ignavibacteria bacterium]
MNDYTEILNSIVVRIIETSKPEKIILFGSAGRGMMNADSDFDFLIIMKNGSHRRRTAQLLYRNIADIGFASDIIVVTEEDIELYKNQDGTIIKPAMEEGKVLYAA